MNELEKCEQTFSAATLELLYDHTFREILQLGLKEVSLKQVALEYDIDPDTVTRTFADNKAFVRAILHWHYTKFSLQMRSIIDMHSNPYAALEAALYEFVELCMDRERAGIGMFRATLIDLCATDETLWQEFLNLHEVWVNLVREKLQQSSALLEEPEEIETLVCYFRVVFVGLYEMIKLKRPKEELFMVVNLALETLKSRMQ